jgi:hypothetical protein
VEYIAFISLSKLFDALLIIALLLFALTNSEGTIIIISLFMDGMITLIAGSGLFYFLVDINGSVAALKPETNFSEIVMDR